MGWLYLPGMEESSSDSDSLSPDIAQSVTLSAKHRPLRRWQRIWDEEGPEEGPSWLKRLSGMTLTPSTADRGVARFIASLPGTHVSPTVGQASSSASMIPGGSGQRSAVSSTRSNPGASSAKMSLVISEQTLRSSPETWQKRISELRQACSLRGLSGHPMSETDFFGLVSTVPRHWEELEDDGGNWLGYWCHDCQTVIETGRECSCLPPLDRPTVWPTPVTRDAVNVGGPAQAKRHTPALNSLLGGAPSPLWLEWYMGLPLSWTDPESTPLATEWFQSWRDAHSYIFSPNWWGIPRLHKPKRAWKLGPDGNFYTRALSRKGKGLDPVQVVGTEDELDELIERGIITMIRKRRPARDLMLVTSGRPSEAVIEAAKAVWDEEGIVFVPHVNLGGDPDISIPHKLRSIFESPYAAAVVVLDGEYLAELGGVEDFVGLTYFLVPPGAEALVPDHPHVQAIEVGSAAELDAWVGDMLPQLAEAIREQIPEFVEL
jgi:hypothetical protein